MPQSERLRVWKGELKKTSGGLRKQDLMKNKRGKIVSRRKSEAAKKSKDNNLGQWLRSKGDQFLSKGLKAENIVRKNKPGRKAFKKKDVPEEKQSEVKKKQPAKKVEKKKAAPKITKTAPIKPGEKPKDKTKITVGNIVLNRKAIKEYKKDAKLLMEEFDYTKKQVIEEMGKPPEGFKW